MLALVVAFALRRERREAIALVRLVNVEGAVDLINAVTRGLRNTDDGALRATYCFPAVVVRALLISYVTVFIISGRPELKNDA